MNKPYHKRNKLIQGYRSIDHPIYNTYHRMKARCYNTKATGYINYGGRGIQIEPEWDTFEAFAKDMFPSWIKGLSIERKNNNKNYCKQNCKWANQFEQSLNRRRFINNKCDATGIYKKGNRYKVQYSKNNIRYTLPSTFETSQLATKARNQFINLLKLNPNGAMEMLKRSARYDSTTKIRGITKSPSGHIVRYTVLGHRYYIGHYIKLKHAKEALNEFKMSRNIE